MDIGISSIASRADTLVYTDCSFEVENDSDETEIHS